MTQRYSVLLSLALSLVSSAAGQVDEDRRAHFDVSAYDLELAVRPGEKVLEGRGLIRAVALVEDLARVQLDLEDLHDVLAVSDGEGTALEFERIAHGLVIQLAAPIAKGATFAVRVGWRGQPKGGDFDGFHWKESADGQPWISTACQGLGAHYWWPCKASFFHPEDKPDTVSMTITCPAGLYAVSNGRLQSVREGAPSWFDEGDSSWQTYSWRHNYPLETYSVTLNVGPFVVVEEQLELPGLESPLPFISYMLPEDAEKAALQFQEVPRLLEIYSEAFGPFPFPESKFGLVETNFWGMEHSTAVAYGSSFPAWCKEHGEKDRYARRNRWFDYILIHEVAHEWWGNAVSAEHWGHFWIHEGFGTYAEGVFVEKTVGREAADRFFADTNRRVSTKRGRLYRGDSPTSREAYSGLIYSKGSAVLNTLRHFVDDDAVWWRSLADFNLELRYGNATTEDFQAILERNTKQPWGQFFQEWFYAEGAPELAIKLVGAESSIEVEVQNLHGEFHVPLDIAWSASGEEHTLRLAVDPGLNSFSIPASAPGDVRVLFLERLLGKHTVKRPELRPLPAPPK